MTLRTPRNARLSSTAKIDQVLATFTGTFDIPNTGTIFSQTRVDLVTNPIGDTCFLKGIVSFDGGASWLDITLFGTVPASPFPSVFMYPMVFADKVAMIIGATAAFTGVMYKFFLMAKPGQSPQPVRPPSNNTIFSSALNYQKIAFDVVNTLGFFNHNLAYVPKVSVFTDNTFGGNTGIIPYISSNPPLVDAVSVTLQDAGPYPNTYFRVYYDD